MGTGGVHGVVLESCDTLAALNDALIKAIESTAKTPQEAEFLRAILQQVDIQSFKIEQGRTAGSPLSIGASIPTPSVMRPNLSMGNLNLMEAEDMALLVNESQEWEDVEFEVALDSGSIVNVCHPDDCPGYVMTESPGSKVGQHFVVGKEADFPTWVSGT